jgi:hypothetical protein
MKVRPTTTPAMTLTLRTMTSSVDGVDEGRAVFSGFIALHLRKRGGCRLV